ncbi:hypothetical protein EDB85DRAFT_2245921 [Lactarius pseudohatsudake]|nr:hypothetical protein EDB85DRAFT_2245921 [Lactarius pseudohatsudake]
MLPLTILRTLNGPIPTPFSGDPTHAAQFLQDLDSLVWKNRNHPLISTPWTRIDLALAFISGPTTLAWRRSIRCGRTTEVTTDTLWNDFLESFCETWVYSPEATTPIAPEMPTSPAVPSPLLTAASTLKRVDDVSIVFTADDLPPRHLLETIDQTADEDDTDDWSSFAPDTSALPPRPPRSPRRQFSPRIASPQSVVLDLVNPADEPPYLPCTPTPDSSIVALALPRTETFDIRPQPTTVASTPSRAENPVPSTPEGSRATSAPLPSTQSNAPHVPTPPTPTASASVTHADGKTTKKRKYETDGGNDTRSNKRIRAQLARRRVPLPQQLRYVRRRPVVPPPPVDDSSGPPNLDLALVPSPDSPSPRLPRRPRRPTDPPSALPSPVFTSAFVPAVVFPSPPPRVLCLLAGPPPPSSIADPLSIVEDDNSPRRGIKPLDASGFSPIHATSLPQTTRESRYTDIFPRHAFEMPRDPDEITPAVPTTPRDHATADDDTSRAQRPLRATAAEFIPQPPIRRPPIIGPTQTHGVRHALQHRIPDIDISLTRAAINLSHAPSRPRQYHANAVVTSLRPANTITENTHNRYGHAQTERHVQQTTAQDRPTSQFTHALTRNHDKRRPGPQQRTHNPPRQAVSRFTQTLVRDERHANNTQRQTRSQSNATTSHIHTWLAQVVHDSPPQLDLDSNRPATRNRVPDRPTDNPYPTDLSHTYEYEADYDDDFT